MMKVPSTVITDGKADKTTGTTHIEWKMLGEVAIGDDLSNCVILIPDELDYTPNIGSYTSSSMALIRFTDSSIINCEIVSANLNFPTLSFRHGDVYDWYEEDFCTKNGKVRPRFYLIPNLIVSSINQTGYVEENTIGDWVHKIKILKPVSSLLNLIDVNKTINYKIEDYDLRIESLRLQMIDAQRAISDLQTAIE